jgi:hypothetical protein
VAPERPPDWLPESAPEAPPLAQGVTLIEAPERPAVGRLWVEVDASPR